MQLCNSFWYLFICLSVYLPKHPFAVDLLMSHAVVYDSVNQYGAEETLTGQLAHAL